MHNYNVTIELDGERRTRSVEAVDPGQAMAILLKLEPDCRIIEVERYSGGAGFGEGFTIYEPPPVVRPPVKDPAPARALRRSERGCEFPFYDEVVSPPPAS